MEDINTIRPYEVSQHELALFILASRKNPKTLDAYDFRKVYGICNRSHIKKKVDALQKKNFIILSKIPGIFIVNFPFFVDYKGQYIKMTGEPIYEQN